MQVCNTIQTDTYASTPLLSFLQAGCPSCRPANNVKALNLGHTDCRICDSFLFVRTGPREGFVEGEDSGDPVADWGRPPASWRPEGHGGRGEEESGGRSRSERGRTCRGRVSISFIISRNHWTLPCVNNPETTTTGNESVGNYNKRHNKILILNCSQHFGNLKS